MRELEGINKCIDFIGNPEWADLHVLAVMVIANCLEDYESVEVSDVLFVHIDAIFVFFFIYHIPVSF